MELKSYLSECSCKNLSYNFYTHLSPAIWLVRVCSCSFCAKFKNHIYCSDPNGYVKYNVKNISSLIIVKHGTRTADFLICEQCNSYMGAVMHSKKGIFSVINIEYLNKNVKISEPYKLKWNNEDKDIRLERRYATWTPVKKYF
tara:strand:- start:9922 stop:10350 length:429 start_codon:yes stop_codon:yes gene_type:complete